MPLPPRRFLLPPLIAAGLAGAFAVGSWHGAHQVHQLDEWADAQLLSSAIDSVRANALDSLPSDSLIRRAITGMLRELHDPYAALLSPDGLQSYRGTLLGEGHGIGLTLRREPDAAGVLRVAEGSPAAVAGLRAGDRILTVNGEAVRRMWSRKSRNRAPTLRDSSVLTIWRAPYDDTLRFTVRRTAWHQPAVTEQGLLADSVGYVRLSSITSHASDELEGAVTALRRRGARSLVMDLRGNTGGFFEEGVKAAGLFLPRGAVVASLAGRGGEAPIAHRGRGGKWLGMPLVVLVDSGTASAAEVIAAALHDYHRALLVGSTTYGKGVVQRVVKVSPDLSLRLTTARWLTPNGVSLSRRVRNGAVVTGGLAPDVPRGEVAPLSDEQAWWMVPPVESALARRAADSVAIFALRARWVTASPIDLATRLADTLSLMVPRAVRRPVARAHWIAWSSRRATERVLEVAQQHEALLRFTVPNDPVLREGLSLLDFTTTAPLFDMARPPRLAVTRSP